MAARRETAVVAVLGSIKCGTSLPNAESQRALYTRSESTVLASYHFATLVLLVGRLSLFHFLLPGFILDEV